MSLSYYVIDLLELFSITHAWTKISAPFSWSAAASAAHLLKLFLGKMVQICRIRTT